ncbi:hypothetical protein KBD08_02570 [Candidatus Babeliales bacterium]|nr:hypothetical protein [Candidatus Babeliales bacterium]
MKLTSKKIALCAFLLISGALFLPGCGWWPFGKKTTSDYSSTGSGEVLLTIDGKPVLTSDEYEEQLDMARQANPQIEMFLAMVPNAEHDFVFKGMETARLVKAWAQKEGITDTPEFQKQLKHLQEAMELQLYMKYFDDAHPINISDADVAAYYDEKKDVIPGLALSQGGIDISFVRFDAKDKADKYFDMVKEIRKTDNFKTLAEQKNHTVGQAVINEKSPFSEAIKTAVLALKKFPSVQVLKAGEGAYWVVFASGKSEAKYHDLKSPQVQQGLRKMMTDERKEKQIEAVMENLKKEMSVVENSKYFEDKEAKKRAAVENNKAMQEMPEMEEEAAPKVTEKV